MNWSHVHDRIGPATLALLPFSLLYGVGWRAYELWYRLGLKKPVHPHTPIVCIGNLQAGGMGKTPLTIAVARLLQAQGRHVVISASGYGAPHSVAAALAPDGPLRASEWGDEPALFREMLPDVPLIVGRRRVLAAEICARKFPDAVMLMDDGLQHKPLHRDVEILVDPDQVPNPFVLPAGPYREPRSNRNRFSLVLPRDYAVTQHVELRDPHGNPRILTPGSPVQILLAIARPWRVEYTLEQMGLKVTGGRILEDHAQMNQRGLLESFDRSRPIIMTLKDWVKFREREGAELWNILILRHELAFEDSEGFSRRLGQMLP